MKNIETLLNGKSLFIEVSGEVSAKDVSNLVEDLREEFYEVYPNSDLDIFDLQLSENLYIQTEKDRLVVEFDNIDLKTFKENI